MHSKILAAWAPASLCSYATMFLLLCFEFLFECVGGRVSWILSAMGVFGRKLESGGADHSHSVLILLLIVFGYWENHSFDKSNPEYTAVKQILKKNKCVRSVGTALASSKYAHPVLQDWQWDDFFDDFDDAAFRRDTFHFLSLIPCGSYYPNKNILIQDNY